MRILHPSVGPESTAYNSEFCQNSDKPANYLVDPHVLDFEDMVEGRKRGRPRVDAKLDDWSEIHDKRERKRVQDRLAQRLRRSRMQSRSPETSPGTVGSTTNSEDSVENALTLPYHTNVPERTYSTPSTASPENSELIDELRVPSSRSDQPNDCMGSESVTSPKVGSSSVEMTCDNYLLGLPAWPIFAALRQHGLMQGITPTNCHNEEVSPLQPLFLPKALRPTPLQLVLSHRRFIDRFPFPRLRDNLIALKHLINLDEFIRDLFSTAGLSYRFDLRRATWESGSWSIAPEFAIKWGYLFH